MIERKSLKLPITLGVLMIVVLVALIVGWVLINVFSALGMQSSQFYWVLLTIGSVLFAFVLTGVIMYLVLTIKTIKLNQRQSNFIDSVTHELKSPIASLKLYLQTLKLRTMSEQEREKFYQHMLGDVERLDQLINHLLEAGQVDVSTPNRPISKVPLAQLIEDCVATVCARYQVPTSVVDLSLIEVDIWAPPVDANMIFRNLIDNAIKYAGDPPEVKIILRRDFDHVVVRICDNGPGIPVAQRKMIFRRFHRIGSELQRDKPGTGLGLYIVRTLVRRLNGSITFVDSKHTTGTVLEVQLPTTAPASIQSHIHS